MPRSTAPTPSQDAIDKLKEVNVPVESLLDACRACGHDCDDDDDDDHVDGYPKGFDVDLESEMLGGIQAYGRQILISTGKANWEREVTDVKGSLAQLVKDEHESRLHLALGTNSSSDSQPKSSSSTSSSGSFLNRLASKFSSTSISSQPPSSAPSSSSSSSSTPPHPEPIALPPGVHPTLSSSITSSGPTSERLSILTSSFVSHARDPSHHSVMVFPDYKVVHDVEPSKDKAKEVVERYLGQDVGREGKPPQRSLAASSSSSLKSWPLPYRAVVLLCSHKTRDKRCHIAAPLLAHQFHHHLEKHDLVVDESGEGLDEGVAIEDYVDRDEEGGGQGEEERAVEAEEERSDSTNERRTREKLDDVLRGISNGESGHGGGHDEPGRVGLFKVSHIGGHRYAGNVIVYFPNGSSVWYGRVTPADVGVIVDRTIMNGKVIPEFLRGGLGLDGKNGAKGILEW
ncbi:hypothetical protein JCM10212_002487 [Sporobolomyces blumeae]